MRIAFVHTVGFLVDRFRGLMQEQHPAADSFRILNEGLLQDPLRGRPTTEVHRRLTIPRYGGHPALRALA